MKSKISIYLFACLIAITGIVSTSSCSSGKTGCPAETANTRPDRKGNFSSRKGSSNLFPKTMRKKMSKK
jgi:hypothetical protein